MHWCTYEGLCVCVCVIRGTVYNMCMCPLNLYPQAHFPHQGDHIQQMLSIQIQAIQAGSYSDLDGYSSTYHNFLPCPRCHVLCYCTAQKWGRGSVVATACSAQLVVVTMEMVHASLSLDHQTLWKIRVRLPCEGKVASKSHFKASHEKDETVCFFDGLRMTIAKLRVLKGSTLI